MVQHNNGESTSQSSIATSPAGNAEARLQSSNDFEQTFGIECEFRLIHPDNDWKKAVADALCSGGVPCLPSDSHQSLGFLTWQASEDNSILSSQPDHRKLEVKSRILRLSEAAEVSSALDTLNKHFLMETDHSMGLHVHQGNSFRGFPLRTLINVMVIQVAFEHLLNQLHPPDRVYTDRDDTHSYANPHSLSTHLQIRKAGLERAMYVLKARSLAELIEFTQDYSISRNCQVNLHNFRGDLTAPEHTQTRTIEFRQHQSTTDPVAIRNWVELTGALVRYAHTVKNTALGRLVQNCTDRKFGVLDLISELGCKHLVEYYQSRLFVHKNVDYPKPDKTMLRDLVKFGNIRSSEMKKHEQYWIKKGYISSKTATLYDHNGNMACDQYIPFDAMPFDFPWDEKMAAATGSWLPEGQGSREEIARLLDGYQKLLGVCSRPETIIETLHITGKRQLEKTQAGISASSFNTDVHVSSSPSDDTEMSNAP